LTGNLPSHYLKSARCEREHHEVTKQNKDLSFY